MEKSSRIFIAGHRGLVGSAITKYLSDAGYSDLIVKSRKELDLMNTVAVEDFFRECKPEYVFLAAAKVGGINANNKYPAEFLYHNLSIQSNIIHQAYKYQVKKLLFFGSSCIYPKMSPQPIKEEYLLSGFLETTNEAYAIAKIAGIKMCQSYNRQYGTNFISVMPTNIFGINDNFHPDDSHVIAALIQRFHKTKQENKKQISIWGSGNPRREFLFADDLADACVFLMNNYDDSEIINVGTGKEITIKDLAELIMEVVDFPVELVFDKSMPDGTLLKRLDISKINSLGWTAKTSLREGLKRAYQHYASQLIDR
jgi:GDP-L-fucose synthase